MHTWFQKNAHSERFLFATSLQAYRGGRAIHYTPDITGDAILQPYLSWQ